MDERPDPGAPASRTDPRVAVTAFALVAIALAAVLVVRSGAGTAAPEPVADLGDPALGDPGAPVELVEYSDFGCPFCERHAREVKPAIIEEYVDTGMVRYVWRDLPYQGDASYRAALAARAAQEQGRFWEYHDALFAHGAADLGVDRLRAVAQEVGLDLEALDEALDSRAHAPLVDAGIEQARALGLSGTPSFTVNGERVLGAQPYEVFADVIDRAVEQAGG